MRALWMVAVGMALAAPGFGVTRVICASANGAMPGGVAPGPGGHGGHGGMGMEESQFMIRVLFASGREGEPSEIEEMQAREGGLPMGRYFQPLETTRKGDFPGGTYVGMTTFGDKAVLTIVAGGHAGHPPGHPGGMPEPGTHPGGHPGHPGGTPEPGTGPGQPGEPGTGPKPIQYPYQGTYAYVIEQMKGVLPVKCRVAED